MFIFCTNNKCSLQLTIFLKYFLTVKMAFQLDNRISSLIKYSNHVNHRCFFVLIGENRSEERRVGKECRYRWAKNH